MNQEAGRLMGEAVTGSASVTDGAQRERVWSKCGVSHAGKSRSLRLKDNDVTLLVQKHLQSIGLGLCLKRSYLAVHLSLIQSLLPIVV